MTKATQTLYTFVAITIVYFLLYTGRIPTSSKFQNEVMPVVPFWALMAFGAYALGTLGYDLLTFNDKPEKYKELLQEIAEAKTDLRQKGVTVD